MMKWNIIYNDFRRRIEWDESKKIGSLLESILRICSLMIYNIEYAKIKVNEIEYKIGSDDLPFDNSFLDFIQKKKIDVNREDYEIILYDRQRDEWGNVIKENEIIDRYNQWFLENENEMYFQTYSSSMDSILSNSTFFQNILHPRILSDIIQTENRSIRRRLYPNNEPNQETNENIQETNPNHTIITTDSSIQWNTNMEQIYNHLIESNFSMENQNNHNIEDSEEEESNQEPMDEEEEIPVLLPDSNRVNSSMSILDQYIRNGRINSIENLNTINHFTEFHSFLDDDLPTLISQDDLEFVDVKIVLSEDEFNGLEMNSYDFYQSCKIQDCLICMNQFEKEDLVIKTCEEHIFHKNCIQNWLCKESNKCPICRKDVGKSKIRI